MQVDVQPMWTDVRPYVWDDGLGDLEMADEMVGTGTGAGTGTLGSAATASSPGQDVARASGSGRQSPQASSSQRRPPAATADEDLLLSLNAAGYDDNDFFGAPLRFYGLGQSLFDNAPLELDLTIPLFSDVYYHGDGSMLVAPGEQSLALTGDDAAASHNATFNHASSPAPALSANMEAATVDAPAAPVDIAPAKPAGVFQGDTSMLDPTVTSTAALDNPPIVAPAAMPHLEEPISLASDMHAVPPGFPMLNGAMNGLPTVPPVAPAEQRLSAFARLRFDDGSYYMHTYQMILGRNVQLAHKDMRRLAKVEQLKAKGEQQRAQALLHGRKRKRPGARSVISEAGGIVNAPMEMMPMEYQQRRQSIASQSQSSASHPPAENKPDFEHAPQEMLMQAFPEAPDQMDSHVPEDPNDCPLVPIHPQHIVDRTGLRGPKGISREHAKIFFNFDTGHFCLEVLGSNGLYHEDTFQPKGEIVELKHGDTITIGMVEMTFFLPDVALTEEERNRPESGSQSRPMSFSFENGRGESEDMDDSVSEDMSVNPRHVYHLPVDSDLESEEDIIGDEDDMDDFDGEDQYSPEPQPKQSIKLKLKSKRYEPPVKSSKHNNKRKAPREPSPEEVPAKKAKTKAHKEPPKEKSKASKGPAKEPSKSSAKQPKEDVPTAVTPSKEKAEPATIIKPESPVALRRMEKVEGDEGETDGIITAEVARQYNLPESLIGTPLQKRKGPGRPPKDGVMSKRQRSQLIKQGKEIEKARAAGIDLADLPQPTVKPKIARRKESNAGEDDDIRETTEKGDGTVGEKKQSKPAKPARTPSPEMRIEDYTEEQLQRPTSNYVVLIHEAISSAPTGQMNLQQIYNYIERNYPWYKFKTTTSGWQSSVRHNLGQHDAFVKGDKEGKGYMWRINPKVSIEKERRKRQVSPPQVNQAQRQGYYPPPNNYSPYGQQGYYPQGVPPSGAPRPPPSAEAVLPRLPPSMARDAGTTAAAAPQVAPAPSPYVSPWAGGNVAGSPANQHAPRPYPPPSSQTPPVSSAAPSSGQYGVLYPTSAPPAASTDYPSAGAYGSPYSTTPGRSPYTPYPPPPPPPSSAQPQAHAPPQHEPSGGPHPSGRYPQSTNADLIRQLEAFRTVYLQTRIEPGEDTKVDNAIKAYVTADLAASLTPQEQSLLTAIKSIPMLEQLRGGPQPIKQEDAPAPGTTTQNNEESKGGAPTATAAAIAADAAANTVPTHPPAATPSSEPQNFTPNMTSTPSTAAPAFTPSAASVPTPIRVQAQRPSVEPLTPVPGSPAVQQNGTPVKRSITELGAQAPDDTASGAQDSAKVEAVLIPKAESNTDLDPASRPTSTSQADPPANAET